MIRSSLPLCPSICFFFSRTEFCSYSRYSGSISYSDKYIHLSFILFLQYMFTHHYKLMINVVILTFFYLCLFIFVDEGFLCCHIVFLVIVFFLTDICHFKFLFLFDHCIFKVLSRCTHFISVFIPFQYYHNYYRVLPQLLATI